MKGIVFFDAGYSLLPVVYKGTITLTKVDDDVAAWAMHHSWCLTRGYAYGRVGGKMRYLHDLVNRPPAGLVTDHINRDRLDNRQTNLRVVTLQQNNTNKTKASRASSRYLGVSWNAQRGRWLARIQVNGALKYLGYFETEADAATVYNFAAANAFGEYAQLNAPAIHIIWTADLP